MSENAFKHIGRRLKELYKDDLDVITEAFKRGTRGDDDAEEVTSEFEVPVEGEDSASDGSSDERESLSKRARESFVKVTRLTSERETRNEERLERELNELREGSYRIVRNERKQLSDDEQIDSILNFSDDAFTPELRLERVEDEYDEVPPSYEKPEGADPFSMILGEMDRAANDD